MTADIRIHPELQFHNGKSTHFDANHFPSHSSSCSSSTVYKMSLCTATTLPEMSAMLATLLFATPDWNYSKKCIKQYDIWLTFSAALGSVSQHNAIVRSCRDSAGWTRVSGSEGCFWTRGLRLIVPFPSNSTKQEGQMFRLTLLDIGLVCTVLIVLCIQQGVHLFPWTFIGEYAFYSPHWQNCTAATPLLYLMCNLTSCPICRGPFYIL